MACGGDVMALPALLEGKQISVVVDTGATSSWLDASLCEKLSLPVVASKNARLTSTLTLSGNCVIAKGVTSAVLCIAGEAFPTGFSVVQLPGDCDAILGCDWLRQNECVVDMRAHQVLMRSPSAANPDVEIVWTQKAPYYRAKNDRERYGSPAAARPKQQELTGQQIVTLPRKPAAPPLQVPMRKQPDLCAESAARHGTRQKKQALNNTLRISQPDHSHADQAAQAMRLPQQRSSGMQAASNMRRAAIPNVLHRSAVIPSKLAITLAEIPAQLDIYGRAVVTLEDVDLGDTGPHAVPADVLQALLQRYADLCPAEIPPGIPEERWLLGPFNVIPLRPDAKGQRSGRYRLSPRERAELDKQTMYLLEQGWIRKSTSEWACSCTFAPKGFQGEDGLRVCQDYRRLNAVTIKNRTPIPRIDDLLDAAAGFAVCSSLDLASGYHQIPLTEDEIPRSAFYGTRELYEFTVMAFGFTNAPAVFQTAMQRALDGYINKFVLVYLDDVLVFSNNAEEHLRHLELVLERFRKYKLYLRLRKCRFNRQELPYLGHILSTEGVRPDPRKVQLVQDWPSPLLSVKAIEQFLGLANYFRKFIRGFGAVTAPLTRLKRKNIPFEWTEECEAAFQYVKVALTSAPVLVPPDTATDAAPFEVICDASGEGIGAGLFQAGNVIAFEGRKYRPAECNYTVGEQELLAVVHALHVWRCYLEGAAPFKVITDHNPLVYINTQQNLSRRQCRWVEFMQRFDFEWVYKPGRTNVADPLSRAPSLTEQPLAHLHDGLALAQFAVPSSMVCIAAPPASADAEVRRGSYAAQVVSLLLLALPASPRLPHLPGGNPSSVLALLGQDVARRRSDRLARRNHPYETEVSASPRRAPVWEAAPAETQPAKGSSTGSAAPEGVAPCAEDRSAPDSPREADGSIASETELGEAVNTADQITSDEELAGLVVDFLQEVRDGYGHDPYFASARHVSALTAHDGLYWRNHQLVIPDHKALRQRCLELTHDAPWAGHFGRDRTSSLVTSIYWWPGIHKDIIEYVKTCPSCQRSKSDHKKPFGLMVPVQVPKRRWTSIGIDFITHLPITASGFDSIAVFVDRLTKRVHLAPCHDTTSTEEFAEIFVRVIFAQHGLPLDIVSDRDSRFTSEFWTMVCKLLNVKQNMSTAFHPRTDGQTERVNRTLEEVLRAYVAGDHSDWDKCLPLAEFAINNSVQSATGTTPFLMDYGQNPLTPDMAALAACQPKDAVFPFIGRWRTAVRRVKQSMHNAQHRYKQLFDKHATDKEFEVGQKVLLASKNMKSLLGKSFQAERSFKLMSKYMGPFPILERIGKVAYKLDLTSASILKEVHPVFHVSLLREYAESGKYPRKPGSNEIIEGEVHHEIKGFSDYRTHYGYPQYFVEYTDNTPGGWAFEEDLREDMPVAIDKFIKDYQAPLGLRKEARAQRAEHKVTRQQKRHRKR